MAKVNIKSEKITPFGGIVLHVPYKGYVFSLIYPNFLAVKIALNRHFLCIIPCWRSDDGEGKVS